MTSQVPPKLLILWPLAWPARLSDVNVYSGWLDRVTWYLVPRLRNPTVPVTPAGRCTVVVFDLTCSGFQIARQEELVHRTWVFVSGLRR